MSLKEEIKDVTGRKRQFLLLRIAGVDTKTTRGILKIPQGTYNSWTSNPDTPFVTIYRRRDELSNLYKLEALQFLRQDNQLAAVFLEGEILKKLREEVQEGNYVLLRTNLARDVYNQVAKSLEVSPETQQITWESRINQLILLGNQTGNQVRDGEYEVIETTPSIQNEHPQSNLLTEGE